MIYIPNWDSYFMTLAMVMTIKSKDIRTRHSAIIVDQNNRIISTGFNSPAQCLNDSMLPLDDLSKKNMVHIHAELNSILVSKQDLKGCKLYVTGPCCSFCFHHVIQAGIREIIYGPIKSKMIENDPKEQEAYNIILKACEGRVIVREFKEIGSIFENLSFTASYLQSKMA